MTHRISCLKLLNADKVDSSAYIEHVTTDKKELTIVEWMDRNKDIMRTNFSATERIEKV